MRPDHCRLHPAACCPVQAPQSSAHCWLPMMNEHNATASIVSVKEEF